MYKNIQYFNFNRLYLHNTRNENDLVQSKALKNAIKIELIRSRNV